MKQWYEVREIDDLILDSERNVTREIEDSSNTKCPHLRKLGNFFFYCSRLVPKGTELRLEPNNRIYLARQRPTELQIFCMDENYRNCQYFPKPSN